MTRFFTLFALASCLLLAACGSSSNRTGEDLAAIVQAERGAGMAAPDKCMVPAGMVGKPHTEVNKMKFKVPVRVIFPGTVVTSDHIANRLNFKVDKKGIIKSVTCG